MRKLLVALLTVVLLLVFSGSAGSVDSMSTSEEKPASSWVFVSSFYDVDYKDLVIMTQHLKKGDTLKITIMSQGGPAVPCMGMVYHVEDLKARGIHVITEVIGMSCSAAAVLWLTGDERILHATDVMMFHKTVIAGWGGPIPRERWDPTTIWIVDQIDYFIRQYLLKILKDTELVNSLLRDKGNKDENTNMNWFNGREIHALGISTKMLDTI